MHATASKKGSVSAMSFRLRDVLSDVERSGLSLERVGMCFCGGLRGIYRYIIGYITWRYGVEGQRHHVYYTDAQHVSYTDGMYI